jgi:hypothetical protein
MSWENAMLWSFVATLVLTIILSGGRGLGMTRMDIPYLLGTIFTQDRDKAVRFGVLFHMANGWVFGLIYVAIFHSLGIFTAVAGATIGLLHAIFVLSVGMEALPSFHPRMSSEQDGPDPTRQLEPPGFLALHYGRQTPIATVFAHLIYGLILGMFYHPSL